MCDNTCHIIFVAVKFVLFFFLDFIYLERKREKERERERERKFLYFALFPPNPSISCMATKITVKKNKYTLAIRLWF